MTTTKKTPRQIRKWMRSKHVYLRFIRCSLFCSSDCFISKVRTVLCYWGRNTMDAAFLWEEAPEGFDFWAALSYEFLDWYNG